MIDDRACGRRTFGHGIPSGQHCQETFLEMVYRRTGFSGEFLTGPSCDLVIGRRCHVGKCGEVSDMARMPGSMTAIARRFAQMTVPLPLPLPDGRRLGGKPTTVSLSGTAS